jgi:hypothetical protein
VPPGDVGMSQVRRSDPARTEFKKTLAFPPVDMFEYVAYSFQESSKKKLQIHDVGSNVIIEHFRFMLINFTEEAAHA